MKHKLNSNSVSRWRVNVTKLAKCVHVCYVVVVAKIVGVESNYAPVQGDIKAYFVYDLFCLNLNL